ncbi:hypothetical protein [Acinetobacter sp. MB5]|uniref:hypothetical protein n=1 Tax=Acinetobacter sp. MB5 TaxID=2069438 RepID=UPI000DCFEA25|nr:hypothetical protein [Acinetobacter sp. MB5]
MTSTQLSLTYLQPIDIYLHIPLHDFTAYCSLSNLDIFWDEQLAEALKASLHQQHFQILAQSVDIQSSPERFIAYLKVLPAQLEVDLSIITEALQQHAPLLNYQMHYYCPT